MANTNAAMILAVGVVVAIGLAVWALAYTYNHVAKGTVENEDIVDGAVTTSKLADGAVTLAKIVADFNRNDGYRYLEEYFVRVPGAAADYLLDLTPNDGVLISAVTSALNFDFILAGTSATATAAQGCTLATNGADDANASIISRSNWVNTNKENTFETAFTLNSIANRAVRVGLGLTGVISAAADNDQAVVVFSTESGAAIVSTLSNLTKMHFIYSVGGTDYITSLPLTADANTLYRVKLVIDSDRKLSLFIGTDSSEYVQYSINNTTTDTLVSAGTTKSIAMTANTNLKPLAAVQTLDSGNTVANISIRYFKDAEKIDS